MNDFMLTKDERGVRDRAREFVKNEVAPEYLRRMDRDEIRFPRELYENYARHCSTWQGVPSKTGMPLKRSRLR